jgi:hypothetical protein
LAKSAVIVRHASALNGIPAREECLKEQPGASVIRNHVCLFSTDQTVKYEK